MSMHIKHIYLFSSFNIQGVSTRYRGIYVLNELKDTFGLTSTFVYPGYRFREIIKFIKAYLSILLFRKKNSVIIFQKLHSKGIYTRLLKFLLRIRPSNTIYDTDDADYIRFEKDNIHHFMGHCKLCTVGSQALFEYTRKKNENVLLLGSPVINHNERKINRNKTLHIGWIGDYGMNNGSTAPYSHKISLTKLFFPILKDLSFTVKLTLLGIKDPDDKLEIEEYFKSCSNIELNIPENINWLDEQGLYHLIKEFDIGVSPMVHHEFNMAKSAFKAKQYLSCGVPVLASPVGENLNVIKDGYNGYICQTSQDFKHRIMEFHEMPDGQYQQLCDCALKDNPLYSIDRYCKDLIRYYSSS